VVQVTVDGVVGALANLRQVSQAVLAIPTSWRINITAWVSGALHAAAGAARLIGGRRAAGGPVTAGVPYLVGERGPELFTPDVSGRIIPNHELGTGAMVPALAGGGGGGGPVVIDMRGSFVAEGIDFERRVVSALESAGVHGRS